ncbi:MAG: hypothetical protein U5O69_00240 [Candidatus Competibacteraceae bacterium]|nr:hypothetical protein [Candidatus Competibacteraceae bacterium]
MIRNFRHKALKALYEQNDASGLNPHNWRMIFRFEGEDAADVDLVDYH